MTGPGGDLVSMGLGGGGWDQQEVRWGEKGGGACRKPGVCGGNGEKGSVRWGTPGQMILPLAEMRSQEGMSE